MFMYLSKKSKKYVFISVTELVSAKVSYLFILNYSNLGISFVFEKLLFEKKMYKKPQMNQ